MNSNVFGSVIENAVREGLKGQPKNTYIGEDGLKHCSVCGEPVEYKQENFGVVPVPCKCSKDKLAAHEAERKAKRISELRGRSFSGFQSGAYVDCTFEADDMRCNIASDYSQCYVDSWDEMKNKGRGILFYGNCGTGKTFYACCITNALIEREIPVYVTNLPQILKMTREEQKSFDEIIATCPLVVIDDLGAERSTDYSIEELFRVVDMRARAKLPLIVTTNLDVKVLESEAETSTGRGRVYDRILGMCPVKLKIDGKSRRQEEARKAAIEERERLKKWRAEHEKA